LGKERYRDMRDFSIQTIEIKSKTSAIEINLIDAYGSITKALFPYRDPERY